MKAPRILPLIIIVSYIVSKIIFFSFSATLLSISGFVERQSYSFVSVKWKWHLFGIFFPQSINHCVLCERISSGIAVDRGNYNYNMLL